MELRVHAGPTRRLGVDLGGRSVEAVLDGATAAGFSGLYVDRAGFFDGAATLESELDRLVGPPAVVSEHGLVFWDLRDLAASQRARLGPAGLARLRWHILSPVEPRFGPGFGPPVEPAPLIPGQPATAGDFIPYPALPGELFVSLRTTGSPAGLELRNPLAERRPVRVRLTVTTNAPEGDVVRFRLPGAPAVPVQATAMAAPVELAVVLPPGSTDIEVTSASGATFLIGNVLVVDEEPAP